MNRQKLSNFWLHVIEGVLYITGICFIAYETVMPKIVESLGGSTWMIAMAPAMMILGSALPSMLVAGYADRLPQKKNFIVINCIGQRLPYLALVPLLLWLGNDYWLAWCVMIAAFMSGIFTGILSPAWFQFVANTVPTRYIPRLFSFRFGIASIFGILVGLLVKWILEQWPGHTGFALLFLAAALLTSSSMLMIIKVREPAVRKEAKKAEPSPSYDEVFRHRNVLYFIIVRAFYCGIYVGLAFIPIRICKVLQLDNSWLGIFTMVVVIGAITGNIFTSFWTHKHSWRSCQLIALGGFCLMFILCLFCHNITMALVIFFVLGFAKDAWGSVSAAFMLNLPGRRLRAKGTAFISITMAPPLILASLAGAQLMNWFNSYNLLFIVAALLMLPAMYFSLKLPER